MTGLIDSLPAWPEEDFAAFGPVEIKQRGKIQQIIGRFLGRNWLHIPHVTHHDEIDVTGAELRRIDWNKANPNKKLSPVVPVIKALALALRDQPQFATSLDASGQKLVYKQYAHIGVAVEVPDGLLVPVLRDCDTKPLGQIGSELAAVAEKARTKGLSMQEMSGGCISLSSLGHIGGTAFTPIINAPEVAILGVTQLQIRACPSDNESGFMWRRFLPLSLSYDHRVINGADAARFVLAVGAHINKMEYA
jgi:pyruvate dehydrogenase E2 component (dihydrolipoamide acetyltransferase)